MGKWMGNFVFNAFQELITDISQSEIDILAEKGILKPEQYLFKIIDKTIVFNRRRTFDFRKI